MQKIITKALKAISEKPKNLKLHENLFELLRHYEDDDKEQTHKLAKDLRVWVGKLIIDKSLSIEEREKFYNLYRKILLFLSVDDFDSYMLYMEIDREAEKRFYQPRRRVLKPVVAALQDLEDDKLDILSISEPPGVGKLLADDTPVFTKKGWKKHGDLVVGDEVVGLDGKFKRVQFVSPKNVAEYEVEFTNHEKIKCHGKHEWQVYDRRKQEYRVLETEYMLEKGLDVGIPNKRGHRYQYQLPFCEPIQGEYKDLAVDPYTFGAWIGDGTTKKPDLTIANTDIEIIDAILSNTNYRISNIYEQEGCKRYAFKGLREDLRSMGLCHSREKIEKSIPEDYVFAEKEQRLEFLAGIIDTDGTLSRGNRYIISTTIPSIKDSVCELVSSFGWRFTLKTTSPKTSTSGIVGRCEVYSIAFVPDMEIPCRVPRKQIKEFALKRKIAIKSITPIITEQGNCIQVEGGIYRVGKTMIPTHNSTLAIFYLSWIMGKYPDMPNLASAHADKLTRSFFDGVLTLITDPEYNFSKIFPTVTMESTNSKDETINLNNPNRFKSLTCRSIDGSLTGATRCEKLLYADDLVSGIEEALSKDRMDKLWTKYVNDLKSRKKNNCKELHVATRWSVHDVIGRLEALHQNNPRAMFIRQAALDENGESNFDYDYGVGFDTAYFQDMRESMDKASWLALFMNEPVEREGLLFPYDELNYYNGVLPGTNPDRIVAVCDVAWGGGDSLSMPIAYIYGDTGYVVDVVFHTGDKDITRPIVCGKLELHRPHQARFEANNGGDEYAGIVDDILRGKGINLNISHRKAPANASKMSRIIKQVPDIKKLYFLDEKHRDEAYSKFMKELTTFTETGKNKHDDAPDSLAMLTDFMNCGGGRIEIFQRPF